MQFINFCYWKTDICSSWLKLDRYISTGKNSIQHILSNCPEEILFTRLVSFLYLFFGIPSSQYKIIIWEHCVFRCLEFLFSLNFWWVTILTWNLLFMLLSRFELANQCILWQSFPHFSLMPTLHPPISHNFSCPLGSAPILIHTMPRK